jgi:ABC-type iron transport system FetAB permease component
MTSGGFGIIDLSWWQLALALLLVLAVAAVSLRERLGLERDLLIGAIRTLVQLYLVGIILAAVFSASRWYWVLLILVGMAAIATRRRLRSGQAHPWGVLDRRYRAHAFHRRHAHVRDRRGH